MKPKSVEVYPVYVCPKCDSRHIETLDYVNKVGKILCYCNNVMELEPIKTFKISPVYMPQPNKKTVETKTQKTNTEKSPEDKYKVYSIEEAIERIRDIELRIVANLNMGEHEYKVMCYAKRQLEKELNKLLTEKNKGNTEQEYITDEAKQRCAEMMVSLGWKKRESLNRIKSASLEFYKQNSGDKIDMDSFEEFASFLLTGA